MSSAYPILLWWLRECVLYSIIIIKSEVLIINHCLGLGHETMVCAVCYTMFLSFSYRLTARTLCQFWRTPHIFFPYFLHNMWGCVCQTDQSRLGDREDIFITHIIVIIKSQVWTFPIVDIFFRGWVPPYAVGFHHNQIIFKVRSWNNGMRCMSFYIRILVNIARISMAQYKTAENPLLTHWSYCSLALSHRYINGTNINLAWVLQILPPR